MKLTHSVNYKLYTSVETCDSVGIHVVLGFRFKFHWCHEIGFIISHCLLFESNEEWTGGVPVNLPNYTIMVKWVNGINAQKCLYRIIWKIFRFQIPRKMLILLENPTLRCAIPYILKWKFCYCVSSVLGEPHCCHSYLIPYSCPW